MRRCTTPSGLIECQRNASGMMVSIPSGVMPTPTIVVPFFFVKAKASAGAAAIVFNEVEKRPLRPPKFSIAHHTKGTPRNDFVFIKTGFATAFKSSISSRPFGGPSKNASSWSHPHGARGAPDKNHACATQTAFGSATAIEL